jgi:hypothetical protein
MIKDPTQKSDGRRKTKRKVGTHLRTDPHVLSQTEHLAETGRLPSIHW